jgi:uncharacterized protein (DUF1330 family)
MSTYAVARLWDVKFGPEIVKYLEKIDATLAPFHGRFLVHGGDFDRLEGNFKGDLIIIEFPDREHARAWYRSKAYAEILPYRLNNAQGETILIDTVPHDHQATHVLRDIIAAAS